MKNRIAMFILVIAFAFNAQAQQKEGKVSAEKMLKKMSKNLNLTSDQQKDLMPLLIAQISTKESTRALRANMIATGKKPSKATRKAFKEKRIAAAVSMDKNLERILTTAQFSKFKEMRKGRKKRAMNKVKEQ